MLVLQRVQFKLHEISEKVKNFVLDAFPVEPSILYTGCPRRKGPNFGRVFLGSNYNDITQNTYIQSSMVTEILAREV